MHSIQTMPIYNNTPDWSILRLFINTIIIFLYHELLIGSRPDLTEQFTWNIGLNITKIPKSYTGPYYKYAKHLEYK